MNEHNGLSTCIKVKLKLKKLIPKQVDGVPKATWQ
jgi:hypothetical protein